MKDRLDILIVGAGHTGLFLAAALAAQGWRLGILDPRLGDPGSREAIRDGRNLALMRSTRDTAERFGIWDGISAALCPVERVEVCERPDGARLAFSMAELDGSPFAYGVEHRTLLDLLLAAARARRPAPVAIGGRLEGLERAGDHMTVRLADGHAVATRLVIGADGRSSRVRERAGLGVDRWRYDQAAICFVVEHQRPHDGTVREWLRPEGPLALLPLPGRRCGVTWVEPAGKAERLAGKEPAELCRLLAEQTEGVLGGMRLVSRVGGWPLGAQHARRYVAPRLLLIGDAAHGVHPIHAQGFNMAVADIRVLAGMLARAAARGEDPGSPELLLSYQRRRWWPNQQRIWFTNGLNRIYSNDLSLLRPLRSGALRLLDGVPPLRRLVARNRMWVG